MSDTDWKEYKRLMALVGTGMSYPDERRRLAELKEKLWIFYS